MVISLKSFGTNFVVCTLNIKLFSVLRVSHFLINLLSISALTKTLNCKIKICPIRCIIHDFQTGKRIGNGKT